MAKIKLDIDDEEELNLIGIQSSWPEHKLVWTLNRLLEVKLKRSADYIIRNTTEIKAGTLFNTPTKNEFSVFECNTDNEHLILVANIGQGKALYDKGRPFDFLLRVESNRLTTEDCIGILSEERAILAIAQIACDYVELAALPFSDLER